MKSKYLLSHTILIFLPYSMLKFLDIETILLELLVRGPIALYFKMAFK